MALSQNPAKLSPGMIGPSGFCLSIERPRGTGSGTSAVKDRPRTERLEVSRQGICRVSTLHGTFRILPGDGGAAEWEIELQQAGRMSDGETSAIVSLSEDLARDVEAGQLRIDDAAEIESAMQGLAYVDYDLPLETERLKQEIGFLPQASIAPEDHVDLLKTHLQLSLEVSPVVASYLLAKLGVELHPAAVEAGTDPVGLNSVDRDLAPQPVPSQGDLTSFGY